MTHPADDHVRTLDPLDDAEPWLDPDSPQARALLARATAAAPARTRDARGAAAAPARRRRPLALTAAAAVAAALAVAVVPGGAPVDARAALLQAAEDTAGFTSGRIVITGRHDFVEVGHSGEFRNDHRFDGDDVLSQHASSEVLPSGRREQRASEFRQVDGRMYNRVGDGGWQLIGATLEDPRMVPNPAAVDPEQLIAVLRGAADVQRTDAPGGGETYRATVTAADLREVPAVAVPFVRAGDDTRPIQVTVTAGADGRLRELAFAHRGEQASFDLRIELSELGEPQAIRPPAAP